MEKLRALVALVNRVMSGLKVPEPDLHGCSGIYGHWVYLPGLNSAQRNQVYRAYNGSLDAAKDVHESALPEWRWSVDSMGQTTIWYPLEEGDAPSVDAGDNGRTWGNPARSLLIVILQTLIERESGK